VFLRLGWPLPVRSIDLLAEFRAITNGRRVAGTRLLHALDYFGIPAMTMVEKDAMIAPAIRGAPFTATERRALLDYCQSDVDALEPLLGRVVAHLRRLPTGLAHPLQRGRYMCAVTRMVDRGVPIDAALHAELVERWEHVKGKVITDLDTFGVYDDTSFRTGLFAAYLARHGMGWPRHEAAGHLRLDDDTFKDMCRRYPHLEPLHQLHQALGQMHALDLHIGSDGRNRAWLAPFGGAHGRTGRNQPSNSHYIFGAAAWVRSLVAPGPGTALAYVDWSAQEMHIAAVLSGDPQLAEVCAGDPYIRLGQRIGLIPIAATKATHPAERAMCKTIALGLNYGMGAQTMAVRTGLHIVDATRYHRALQREFPVYFAWAREQVDSALLRGRIETLWGWPYHLDRTTGETPNRRTLMTYAMQANGAEMLRLACSSMTEAGIAVCGPVHDAVLVEAPAAELDEAVAETRRHMAEASRVVLQGHEVPTAAEIIPAGDRFRDERGVEMWATVMRHLGRAP
jgi:hypothetical protein